MYYDYKSMLLNFGRLENVQSKALSEGLFQDNFQKILKNCAGILLTLDFLMVPELSVGLGTELVQRKQSILNV